MSRLESAVFDYQSVRLKCCQTQEQDWQKLDHNDKSLWQKGLAQLKRSQNELLLSLKTKQDDLLERIVPQRKYDFRKLLYGIIQHDIYHTGQIVYLEKLL